ncbi:SAV_915 family protein [Streptomyces sp. NPDC006798]|uniref:SAV_915 family protein n=1 Tax=Streptomyces sp. NPDC006798 TaxID=3155462 RepID=UPI0033C13520
MESPAPTRSRPRSHDGVRIPAPDGGPDAPDPEERPAGRPAGRPGPGPSRPLYVPVGLGSAGGRRLRFLRTPLGARTAVAFTDPRRLAAAMGRDARWIRLAEPALRALAEPLGVTLVTVDPLFTAPLPAPGGGTAPRTAQPGVRRRDPAPDAPATDHRRAARN